MKILSINRTFVILLIIVLAGFLIRVYNLGSIPSGFQGDEVDAGYEGKYILDYGKDTSGQFYPLSFNRFGDFRPTGIFYFAGISENIFGVNEFAVRFPSALFGALTIIVIFFLAKTLFKNESVALLASFFLALNLWHYDLSRATSESIIASFFILSGSYFSLLFFEGKKKKYFVLSLVSYTISYFFYHIARVVVPIILIYFLGSCFFKDKKYFIKYYCGLGIFSLILSAFFLTKAGGRAAQVSLLNVPGFKDSMDYLFNGDGSHNILIARTFHNKLIFLLRLLAEQYISYFSGVFLFIKGGLPQRYQVPEVGLFTISQLFFIIAGLIAIIRRVNLYKNNFDSFVLYLLLIAPIPAALTWDDVPNVQRSSFLIFPLILFSAYGAYCIFKIVKKRYLQVLLVLLLVGVFTGESIYGFHQYFVHFSQYRSYARDDGVKDLMLYIKDNKNKYKDVYISGNVNPLFYLFFADDFRKNIVFRFDNEPEEIKIDNIHFVKNGNIFNECIGKWLMDSQLLVTGDKLLIIDSGNCPDSQEVIYPFRTEKIIKRQDQTKAFAIFSYNY